MDEQIYALLVEDDCEISELVSAFLSKNGLRVNTATSGRQMDQLLEIEHPDIILLDQMLPGENGLEILRRIKPVHQTPIIMLTALQDEADKVIGLELGADDYLWKPFNQRELLARIRAVLRRYKSVTEKRVSAPDRSFIFDGWSVNRDRRTVFNPVGKEIELTSGEFDLLVAFCENPQRVLSRHQLIDLTHGRFGSPFDRSIDTLVGRLRNKFETDTRHPKYLKTVRLEGYIFASKITNK